MLAAIPTTYKGIRFRSRLEARWAAYFDLIGWHWDYEPIDLDGYIPDFIHRSAGYLYLIEIKPIYDLAAFRYTPECAKMLRAVEPVLGLNPFELLDLCGVHPRAGWMYHTGLGWSSSGHTFSHRDAAWAEAGNIVQWKAPK